MKAHDFLRNIGGSVGIFFHDDTDGVCSAAIVIAYLRQINIRPKLFCGDLEEEMKEISERNFDKIIILDFPVDQYPEFLEDLEKKNVLVVDHHPITNDLNKVGILHVNPRFKDPKKYISTSRIIFRICKKVGLKNYEFLKRLGDVGDYVIKGTEEEKEADRLIAAVKAIKGTKSLIGVAKNISRIKELKHFIYGEYGKYKDRFEKELEEQIDSFKSEEGKVIFFEVKSEYNILAYLSSYIFELFPEKTIVLYRERMGTYGISGRSKKYNMGKIFKKASEGIGKGGGHPVAAGARIKSRYFDKFKKRVMRLIS